MRHLLQGFVQVPLLCFTLGSLPAQESAPASHPPSAASPQSTLRWDPSGLFGFSVSEYNRVDGLALVYGFRLQGQDSSLLPRLEARVLWRSARNAPGWLIRGEKDLPLSLSTWVGVEFHRVTQTNDGWRIGAGENSLSAILFGVDRRNYYEEEGVAIYGAVKPAPTLTVRIGYGSDAILSLGTHSVGTVFEGDDFRPNPPIAEGHLQSLRGQVSWDTRDNLRAPRSGWLAEAELERAGDFLGGDFTFWRGWVHLRRYWPLPAHLQLDARLLWAGPLGDSSIPPQRWYTLGGTSALRGFPDFAFRGDGLLLSNVEVRTPLPLFSWITPVFFTYDLVFFLDAGAIHAPGRGLRQPAFDIGAGLGGMTVFGYLGIYLAQKLNRFENFSDSPRVTLRLRRDF